MTIYLSGAVTGTPNNNKRAFQNAYRMIAELGRMRRIPALTIINPLHIGRRLEKSFSRFGKQAPQWADYMRADIKKLCDADCLFCLPGWARSEGASMERYIAKKLGIPCADTMDALRNILGELS